MSEEIMNPHYKRQKHPREVRLEQALISLRGYAATAVFGGWRHQVYRMANEALLEKDDEP